jgi:tRNA-intron endonuclease
MGRRGPRPDVTATFDGEAVHAGPEARERFYDSRGYGEPVDGDLVLAPVEAAHLLYRGDLATVVDDRPDAAGEELDFRGLLRTAAVSEVAFLVYKDLRDRGFYLAPDGDAFAVFPRGAGPWDDQVAYRVRPTSERSDVPAATLTELGEGEATGVLAVVDEESELTYLELDRPAIAGSTFHDLPEAVPGDLLADRVLVPDAPETLHERAFYGQRLDDDGLLQLSLVEAAYLAGTGVLAVDGGQDALAARGREVEGERFDRRLRAYSALRTAGVVPKTGFKFGADFRTYADVDSVENLGHSELLVRVLPPDHNFAPRDLALDVRLAHGVRKEMVYALTGPEVGIEWLSVARLTP